MTVAMLFPPGGGVEGWTGFPARDGVMANHETETPLSGALSRLSFVRSIAIAAG
jgi:hypothetical protein